MQGLGWKGTTVAIALALGISGRAAHAQLAWSVYGVGEFDTSDVVFVLGGVSVAPARSGWVPVAGVSASWLQYPIARIGDDDSQNVTTVTPTIGIANNFNGGAFQLRTGYAFSSGDSDAATPIVAGDVGEDGVVLIGQVDYWGTGGWGGQAIASYNFGGEALWTRGRLTQRIFSLGGDGQIRAGAEAAYLNSEGYSATQVGGVVGFHPGRGAIITAGIGRKLADEDDATYFRVEIVLVPR
jgi:hypothetical protein